jgi:hypothetical protein
MIHSNPHASPGPGPGNAEPQLGVGPRRHAEPQLGASPR